MILRWAFLRKCGMSWRPIPAYDGLQSFIPKTASFKEVTTVSKKCSADSSEAAGNQQYWTKGMLSSKMVFLSISLPQYRRECILLKAIFECVYHPFQFSPGSGGQSLCVEGIWPFWLQESELKYLTFHAPVSLPCILKQTLCIIWQIKLFKMLCLLQSQDFEMQLQGLIQCCNDSLRADARYWQFQLF